MIVHIVEDNNKKNYSPEQSWPGDLLVWKDHAGEGCVFIKTTRGDLVNLATGQVITRLSWPIDGWYPAVAQTLEVAIDWPVSLVRG